MLVQRAEPVAVRDDKLIDVSLVDEMRRKLRPNHVADFVWVSGLLPKWVAIIGHPHGPSVSGNLLARFLLFCHGCFV